MASPVRHRVFITYHHDDQAEVDAFIHQFDHRRDVFIARAVGSDETMEALLNDKAQDDYIMGQIRQKYMADSTVTLAFVGEKTWSRKFVDWELAASLHQGPVVGKPNGVLAILSPKLSGAVLPDRLEDNWMTGYAKFYPYPRSGQELSAWIEEAFRSRESAEQRELVRNGKRKWRRNLNPVTDHGQRVVRKPDLKGICTVAPGVVSRTRSVEPRRPYLGVNGSDQWL